MSSIGPTNDAYFNYKRAIDNLQDDFKKQDQKSKQRNQDQIDSLEEKQQFQLRKKDETAEKTIRDVKESSDQALTRERINGKNDVERLKADTYDRFGKKSSAENETLRQQLHESAASSDAQEKNLQTRLEEREKSFSERMETREREHAADKESFLTKTRTEIQEQAQERGDQTNEANRAYLKQKSEEYGKLAKENSLEVAAVQKRAVNAVNEAQSDAEKKSVRSDVRYQDRLLVQDHENQKKLEQNAEMEKRSRTTEVRDLKDSLMAYRDNDTATKAKKIRETAQENNETEHDWKVKLENVQSNSEREIARRNALISTIESTSADKHAKTLREKSDYLTGVIAEQNAAQQERERGLAASFTTNQKATELNNRHQAEITEKNQQERMAVAGDQANHALAEQAHTFQNTLQRTHQEDNEKIDALQKHVATLNTTDKVALVSPAVENAIRKNVTEKYEQTLATERERNAAGYESLHRNSNQKLRDQTFESTAKQTVMNRENALELQQTRSQLNATIRDTEMSRDATLKEQEAAHARELDTSQRNSGEVIAQMRRRYEDLIQTHQDESRTKIATLRQEAEFASRMTQRAFSTKQNELIREYEKKLSEQKAMSTSEVNELKGQMDIAVRESERKTKSALDEQARTYEQRIAQLDLQAKEHERVLARNHDEELEKVKHSNALLISKKS